MHVELDKADLRILEVLQQHGNLSAAEVAEKVDMTTSTCWRRITRLEEAGVIKSRVTLLDREKVGLNVTVFSRVKLVRARARLARQVRAGGARASRSARVLHADGGHGLPAAHRACATSRRTRRSSSITSRGLPGVESVHSSIALSTIKETTALPLSRR